MQEDVNVCRSRPGALQLSPGRVCQSQSVTESNVLRCRALRSFAVYQQAILSKPVSDRVKMFSIVGL